METNGTSVAREVTPKPSDSKCLILSFVPRVEGKYTIEATLYGENVKHSPLQLKVEIPSSVSVNPVAFQCVSPCEDTATRTGSLIGSNQLEAKKTPAEDVRQHLANRFRFKMSLGDSSQSGFTLGGMGRGRPVGSSHNSSSYSTVGLPADDPFSAPKSTTNGFETGSSHSVPQWNSQFSNSMSPQCLSFVGSSHYQTSLKNSTTVSSIPRSPVETGISYPRISSGSSAFHAVSEQQSNGGIDPLIPTGSMPDPSCRPNHLCTSSEGQCLPQTGHGLPMMPSNFGVAKGQSNRFVPIQKNDPGASRKGEQVFMSNSKVRLRGNPALPDLKELYRIKGKVRGHLLFTLGDQKGGIEDVKLKRPIGCCEIEDTHAIVICDTKHDLVKMYTNDGTPAVLVGRAPGVEFHDPSAVVLLPELDGLPGRCFAVKDDLSIQLFRVGSGDDSADDGEFVKEIGRMELKDPKGLAVTDDGHLITFTSDQKTGDLLWTFDPVTGRCLKKVDFNAPGHTNQCYFLHCFGDVLVVSNLGKDHSPNVGNCIFLWSLSEEKCLAKFGGVGTGAGQFHWPTGTRIDGGGNILIGDAKNNRIQLFDREANFVCVLDLEVGAPHVSDIHLTTDGRLIVMSALASRSLVYVYQLC